MVTESPKVRLYGYGFQAGAQQLNYTQFSCIVLIIHIIDVGSVFVSNTPFETSIDGDVYVQSRMTLVFGDEEGDSINSLPSRIFGMFGFSTAISPPNLDDVISLRSTSHADKCSVALNLISLDAVEFQFMPSTTVVKVTKIGHYAVMVHVFEPDS